MLLCLLFTGALCRSHKPRRHHRVDSSNKQIDDIKFILSKLHVHLRDQQQYERDFLAAAPGLQRFVWAPNRNHLLRFIRMYVQRRGMAPDRRATWLPVFNDVRIAAGRARLQQYEDDITNVLLCFVHANSGALALSAHSEEQIRYNPGYGRLAVAMYYMARQALPNAAVTRIQGLAYKLMHSVLFDMGGYRLMVLDDDALFYNSAWLRTNLPPKDLKVHVGSEALIEMQQVISGLAGSLMSLTLRFDLMKSVLRKPYPLAYALAKTAVIARHELFLNNGFKTCLSGMYRAQPVQQQPVQQQQRDMDDPIGAARFYLRDRDKCVSQVTSYDGLCDSICDHWKKARYATKEARQWIKTKSPETLFDWPV